MEESNIHAGTGITEVWARRSITSVNREVVVEQARSNYRSNLEYDLQNWSKENGFEFVSCEGSGGDDGYEPKFRRGWY